MARRQRIVEVEKCISTLDLDKDQAMMARSVFTEKTCDAADFSEYVEKTFPDIYAPYEIVIDYDTKECKSHKTDLYALMNCLPMDIYSEPYKEMKDSLVEFIKDQDDTNISFVDAIFIIASKYIEEHNRIVGIYENLQTMYSKLSDDVYVYQNIMNNFIKPENAQDKKPCNEDKPEQFGFVYIARCASENIYKIGMTKYLTAREKALGVGNHDLTIFAYAQSNNAKKLESLLHDIYKSKNVSGEWFELEKQEIDDIITSFCFTLAVEDKELAK